MAALSKQDPTRPIDWSTPRALHAFLNSEALNSGSEPRSEWDTTPLHVASSYGGCHLERAGGELGVAVLADGELGVAVLADGELGVAVLADGEPGTRRLARSRTEAKYNLPSLVGSSVRSPHHLSFRAAALKSRLTRSAKGTAALSGQVKQW
jgi:hypothetical protein